jgi:hypothetical protein
MLWRCYPDVLLDTAETEALTWSFYGTHDQPQVRCACILLCTRYRSSICPREDLSYVRVNSKDPSLTTMRPSLCMHSETRPYMPVFVDDRSAIMAIPFHVPPDLRS